MIRVLSISALALFLAACAATPRVEPVLNGPIVNVHSGDLKRYWVPGRETVEIPPPAIRVECGHVIQQFVIDSAGELWDFEVLSVGPDDRLEGSALRAVHGSDFQPAESNPERTPVRVRLMTTFTRSADSDTDCDFPEVEELAPRQAAD